MLDGPNRWPWDLPLHINEGLNELNFNPCVITKFNNLFANEFPEGLTLSNIGTYESTFFSSQASGGIRLPSMWDSEVVVDPGGDASSMTDLAACGLFVRGLKFPSGAHNGRWQNVIPFFGAPGIHTFPQEQLGASRPFDCVQYFLSNLQNDYNPRNPGASTNVLLLDGSNPFNHIMGPFKFNKSSFHSPDSFSPKGFSINGENSSVKEKISDALEKLKIVTKNINRKSDKLYIDHNKAKQQFKRNIDAIISTFEVYDSKYKLIISKNINPQKTAQKVNGVEDKDYRAYYGESNEFKHLFKVSSSGYVANGASLNSLFQDAHINSMSYSMALIEILLKRTNFFYCDWFQSNEGCVHR